MDMNALFDRFADRIMRERTALLAARDAASSTTGSAELMTVVMFDNEALLLPARHVLRLSAPHWTSMPVRQGLRGDIVRGMHGYLSELYTVLDPAPLLGLPGLAEPRVQILLRPDPAWKGARVALLASRVADIVAVDAAPGPGGTVRLPDGRIMRLIAPDVLLPRVFGPAVSPVSDTRDTQS
ncbi:hypothetical protein AA103196_2975 [Ameyamaea chiangmaiensis NBRC 103196]|uniref:CheW-like domain-containing protein n=1 Tax=Ameyamaea chiangmaiensis TaxID=442969 RepID=A0A850PIU4_9PROT|nr:hypothetical protein [Ameyamaea chiangmaiensis]MBS4074463.1 hypothetical protein [Ameyamaea chiangmaiensis]NVN41722.1 hypothetical protein [Ameyamaea chiangmaiensis]GBQ72128.1 hypothetical protein AA103196_2975 [Ameyamaea chiangmaiensis NBRC 103196]